MWTIKSTRREEIEMIGNLNMFRNACFHLHDSTMNVKFKIYIENMVSGRDYYASISNMIQIMHPSPVIDRISTIMTDNFNTARLVKNKNIH